ncbi:hypothetical protein SUGI_0042820 [Cryptomeria japonica]|nr:hypothetical protein SUGI_0042820 [Cryptomeria japonica]
MADEQNKISLLLLHGIKLGGMSLGLFYFICLILSDNWSALKSKPRTWWIPGKALILSALSIQVLSYLDYSNIRFSDVPNAQGVAKLLGNQLVIDSGRLVICVFIGYLLPGMATRGSAEASADIVALVVSLFAAITSELFYVYKAEKEDYTNIYDFLSEFSDNPQKVWFIASSSVFLLAILLLILFLVSAILAGKTVRCMLKQRIISALSFNNLHQGEECWEKFDDEVLKQWLLCRAAQPQYVIARSVLSSSTGLAVTICIVLFVAKTLKLGSNILHLHDGLDWLRHTIFVLQCFFLLLGGWVIFRRWFMAVIYFPIFFGNRKGVNCCLSLQRCSVEDFWTRSILELINMYDLQQWRRDQKPAADRTCFGGIIMKVFTKLKLHKLLYFIWAVQKLLVWFSKCCWLFSEMFFGSMAMRRALIGNNRTLFYEIDPSVDYQQFLKYKEALENVCMPGETPASLWLTNKDSVDQAKDRIEKGSNLTECKELIQLIHKHSERPNVERFGYKLDENLLLVKEYFPTLNDTWWKITAVSLLKIIIKIDAERSEKEKAIKAYKQAWDLMSFVESSNTEQPNSIDVTQVFDFEADLVSMVADMEFKNVEKMQGSSREDAAKAIKKEFDEAVLQLQTQNLWNNGNEENNPDVEKGDGRSCDTPQDSKDWNKIVPSYSMYRVCKKLESLGHVNIEDLRICLGDVIADCVEQLPSILVRSFREWTVEHQDDSMWEAFHIAGKCKQVVHECGLKPNWKSSEQKVSETTEGQNN